MPLFEDGTLTVPVPAGGGGIGFVTVLPDDGGTTVVTPPGEDAPVMVVVKAPAGPLLTLTMIVCTAMVE